MEKKDRRSPWSKVLKFQIDRRTIFWDLLFIRVNIVDKNTLFILKTLEKYIVNSKYLTIKIIGEMSYAICLELMVSRLHIKNSALSLQLYTIIIFQTKSTLINLKIFGKMGKSTKTNTQQFKNYNNEAMSNSLVNNQNWNSSIRKTNNPVMDYMSK